MSSSLGDALRRDFVCAMDGRVYVRGRPKRGRRWFMGLAISRRELARLEHWRVLAWAITGEIALGSDGRVYVFWSMLPVSDEGRDAFLGYELTHEDEFHQTVRRMASEVQWSTCRLIKRWPKRPARRAGRPSSLRKTTKSPAKRSHPKR